MQQESMQNGTRPTPPARMHARWLFVLVGLVGWLGACDGGRVEDAAIDAQGDRVSTSDTSGGTSAEIPLFAPPLAPDATLAEALRHPDPFQRVKRVAEILETARPEELGKILATFESAPLPWGDTEYALFASWWARFDPEEAIFYCFDDEMRLNHPRAIREVLRVWGQQDPAATIASNWLIGSNPMVPGLNPAFVEPFVIGWFESGKPGLLEWIETLDAASKAASIGTYFRMLVLRDGTRNALEWARTAPVSQDTRRLFVATGLNVAARVDPVIALEFFEKAKQDAVDTRTFAARLSRGWASHDPKAAMEWVLQQDIDPKEQWRTLYDVADIWMKLDEKAVRAWLDGKQGDASLDLIRKQWHFNHVKVNRYRVDWPALIQTASQVVDERARRAEYLWIVQRWRRIEPEAAAAWLETNSALLGDSINQIDMLLPKDAEAIDKILAEEKAGKPSAS